MKKECEHKNKEIIQIGNKIKIVCKKCKQVISEAER